MTVQKERILFSLNGSSPTAKGPINLPAPRTRGILASSINGLLMPFDPCNAGHAKCLDFEIPPASIVSPERPAPTDSYGYVLEVSKAIDVLRSATSINAEILQMSGELGCIQAGAFADILVLEGNPFADHGLFRTPHKNVPIIMKGGAFVRNDLN